MAGVDNTTDQSMSVALEPIKNIVLVGRTGNGKSATGNSLVGKEVFISETHAVGITMKCQTSEVVTHDGSRINVIDTPGLFDLSVSAEYLSKEIINCLVLAKEGLHAVVLVLSVRTRISQEEESTLQTLQVIFGSKIVDYLIVLFTGGDELELSKKTLDDYLSRGCPDFLKTVLKLCGGRRILFDNRTTDEGKKAKQVHDLLIYVADIEKNNNGIPFTDEMHRKIKREAEILNEQQKEAESKNLADTELEKLKKQLQMDHDQNMKMMAQMLENTLKEASAKQERMLQALKENMQEAHSKIEYEESRETSPHYVRRIDSFDMVKACNIL